MHADLSHPGLRKYREARERGRQMAILRNQIKAANPTLSQKQVEEVLKGHLKAQQVQRVAVKSRNGQVKRVEVVKI